ncbi:hypothetical protein Elgi_40730 [Paenibacillus elgii]|uniref:hypothetical protein n=1 Tax=Paenibacillus elgii TaxID=189691 RepID=UPI002D7BE55C|nr:hypothetical protein Elgi_40730 [Paenibacillus elgii]
MFKAILRGILPLILLILTSCAEKKDVILTATSSEWRIEIYYKVVQGKYEEIPSVQYIGKKTIGEKVKIDINYTNNSATTNTLSRNDYSGMQMLVLPTRTVVKDWKTTKNVTISWEDEDNHHEETIVPKIKIDDSEQKLPL